MPEKLILGKLLYTNQIFSDLIDLIMINKLIMFIATMVLTLSVRFSYADDFNNYLEILKLPPGASVVKNSSMFIHENIHNGSIINSKEFFNEESYLKPLYVPTRQGKIFPCLSDLQIQVNASSSLKEPKVWHVPQHAIDFRLDTAWVEGKDDFGYKEFINFKFQYSRVCLEKHAYDNTQPVLLYINPGFGGFDRLFRMNNRLKTAIFVIKVSNVKRNNKIFESVYGITRLNFKDENKMNLFWLPEYKTSDTINRIEYTLFIESVYPGSKCNDTCISEIIFGIH